MISMVVDTFVNMTRQNIHKSMVGMSKWWLPWLLGQLSPYWGNCACLGQNVFEVNRETGLDCSTITAPSLVNKHAINCKMYLHVFLETKYPFRMESALKFLCSVVNYKIMIIIHASCNASYHNLFCLWFGILVAMKTLH